MHTEFVFMIACFFLVLWGAESSKFIISEINALSSCNSGLNKEGVPCGGGLVTSQTKDTDVSLCQAPNSEGLSPIATCLQRFNRWHLLIASCAGLMAARCVFRKCLVSYFLRVMLWRCTASLTMLRTAVQMPQNAGKRIETVNQSHCLPVAIGW